MKKTPSSSKKKQNKKNKKSTNKDTNHKKTSINEETLEALTRLENALSELDDKGTSMSTVSKNNGGGLPMSHWRKLPSDVEDAYRMMQEGAEMVKATSTKYTLLGKINLEDGSKLAEDLRKGCEVVATASLLLHQPSAGCTRSTRKLVKAASRSIVVAVASLVRSFADESALSSSSGSQQLAAQKTGAVWTACDHVISRLGKGNRTCMRRELFTWLADCDETFQEFQQILLLGPIRDGDGDGDESGGKDGDGDGNTSNSNNNNNKNATTTTTSWDDFCENTGTGDQYTTQEIPIVQPILALIKCTRGIINLALKACECAGDAAAAASSSPSSNLTQSNQVALGIYQWISNLHEMVRPLSDGVTDLGMFLYPPLDKDTTTVRRQIELQKDGLFLALHFIRDALPPTAQDSNDDNDNDNVNDSTNNSIHGVISMSDEVLEMTSKLLTAVEKRYHEAVSAIDPISKLTSDKTEANELLHPHCK